MLTVILCSEYWSNVIQNAIGCTIGSLLAILVSFLIYFKTIKKNQQEIQNEKGIEEKRRLKAFSLMLQDLFPMLSKQKKAIEIFISEIEKKPNQFPLMDIYPLASLKRITEDITIERTGFAYMNYFKSNNAVKNFTDIIRIIDYLFAELLQLQDTIKIASRNDFERRMRVSDDLDASIKLINDFFMTEQQDIHANNIFKIKKTFDKTRGELDNFESVNSLLFIPVKDYIINNNPLPNRFISDLFYYTSKGMEHYEDIIFGYKKFKNEVQEIFKKSNEQIDKLSIIAKQLLDSKEINA